MTRSEGTAVGAGSAGSGRRLGLGGSDLAVADDDEGSADRHELALLHEDAGHLPAGGRGDLDGRLVGLDLDERVVFVDHLADLDEPAGDLAFGHPFAEVGKLELVRH